jgi:hypothetical protein
MFVQDDSFMTINKSVTWDEGVWWELCYWCFSIMGFGHWRH